MARAGSLDELVEQVVAHLTYRGEKAQAKVRRCHVAEEVGIEGSILRQKSADQNGRSIPQS